MRRACIALVALTVAGACTRPGSALPDVDITSGPVEVDTPSSAPSGIAPLTGLPLFNPNLAARPAVMVKVDNDPKARPQSGLDKADIVYEEMVEGTVVRFLAVFQSRDTKLVGPIRSVRSTDPPIVAPLRGVFVFSGGIREFEAAARRAAVKVVTETEMPDAFHLRRDRQRPYRTYADTAELRALAPSSAKAPPGLFDFLAADEPFQAPGAAPASRATVVFGTNTTALWDYDSEARKWKRTTNGTVHRTDQGTQLAFTNVILQYVTYRSTGFKDPSGAPVDHAVMTGTGQAVLLTQGQQVPLNWSKPNDRSVTTFTDVNGRALRLPAGQTWVSLVPKGAPVTVVDPTKRAGASGTRK